MHDAVEDQMNHPKNPAMTTEARVACHTALKNLFAYDFEDAKDYGTQLLAQSREWRYNPEKAAFNETISELRFLQSSDVVMRLLQAALPEDQTTIHAELDLLNMSLVEMETSVPETCLDEGRLSWLHKAVRQRIRRLRTMAIDKTYMPVDVEQAKTAILIGLTHAD